MQLLNLLFKNGDFSFTWNDTNRSGLAFENNLIIAQLVGVSIRVFFPKILLVFSLNFLYKWRKLLDFSKILRRNERYRLKIFQQFIYSHKPILAAHNLSFFLFPLLMLEYIWERITFFYLRHSSRSLEFFKKAWYELSCLYYLSCFMTVRRADVSEEIIVNYSLLYFFAILFLTGARIVSILFLLLSQILGTSRLFREKTAPMRDPNTSGVYSSRKALSANLMNFSSQLSLRFWNVYSGAMLIADKSPLNSITLFIKYYQNIYLITLIIS